MPTMTPEERQEYLDLIAEEYEGETFYTMDGFEDCLLYYMEIDGRPRAVYCYEDLVEKFAKENRCTYTEAVEFVDFNVVGSLHFDGAPLLMHRINRNFTTLDPSYYEKQYSDE